jgi:hypothetical protein
MRRRLRAKDLAPEFGRGVGLDLLDGGEAEEDFFGPVVAKGLLTDLRRGVGDFLRGGAFGDERADLLGDEDEFVEGDAALVAGTAAGGAATAAVELDLAKFLLAKVGSERLGRRT